MFRKTTTLIGATILVLAFQAPLLAQNLLWSQAGDFAGDYLGSTVAVAGDTNGDGVVDFAVTALASFCGGPTYVGLVQVFDGKTGAKLQSACGPTSSLFGYSLAGGIDADGDGFDDFIVGDPVDNLGAPAGGSYSIYSGRDASLLRQEFGGASEAFGAAVARVGDLDGDGTLDYAVGATDTNFGAPGYANVYSTVNGALLYRLVPSGKGTSFGDAVADAGDVNADGVSDVLVGDLSASNNGSGSGTAWVFSGKDGSAIFRLDGESSNDNFGDELDGLGDVNADGFDDFIVAAPDWSYFDPDGKVYVYSGKDASLLYSYTGEVDFGFTVSRAGDPNHDGYADFLVGEPNHSDLNCGVCGGVDLYSGRNGLHLYHWHGQPSSCFGCALAGGADVDGDGRTELIVGSLREDSNGVDSGTVYVYSLEEFYCNATPKTQNETRTIDVQMAQTDPGKLVGLAIVGIDGVPTFSFVAFGTADGVGRWVVSGTVPRGSAGHDVDIQSFAIGFDGSVVVSNVEHLEFIP